MATPKASESPAYCRCCLTYGAELLFEVFAILEEFKCSICDLIAGCCGIIISDQDDSSKNICGVCLQDLCNTYRFRSRCLRTNRILRKTPSHSHGKALVMKSDPESNNKAPSVSCTDAKEKNQSVSTREKETQTEKLDKEKGGTKQGRTFTCFACRDTFLSRQKLMNHVPIHRCPYQCNVCLKRFRRSDDLLLHRGTHQGTGRYGRITLNLNQFERWEQRRYTPFV